MNNSSGGFLGRISQPLDVGIVFGEEIFQALQVQLILQENLAKVARLLTCIVVDVAGR